MPILSFEAKQADEEHGFAAILPKREWKECRRVQLLTVEGLLYGTQGAEHPDYEPESEPDWHSSRKSKLRTKGSSSR